jgi:hypothetical protein
MGMRRRPGGSLPARSAGMLAPLFFLTQTTKGPFFGNGH